MSVKCICIYSVVTFNTGLTAEMTHRLRFTH
jgi:hypothetical protein